MGVVTGLAVGLALAGLVVLMNANAGRPAYALEIMLPGALVGLIVGYATMKYREA
jgi:hypothetical protein